MMTVCFHLNDRIFSPNEILSLAVSYRLLPQLASELIIDQAISSITCTLEEQEAVCRQFYEQNRLVTEEQRQIWLKHYGMTPEQLEAIPIRSLRIEKFKQATWGHRLEAHFLAHKAQFDQVIYSQICTKDTEAAQELYFRILDGEQSFAELAKLYSQSAEAGQGGRIGPVALSQIHPVLAQKLSIGKSGQVWPLMQLEEWTVIVRLEQFISAQLDEPMRQTLLNHLFENWAREQLQQHNYFVQPVLPEMEPLETQGAETEPVETQMVPL
jgi:parvulin-like peptidyl-prolyl isomerase